ncbi:hypothetical protein V1264_008692 [Littorina saxatilis]|uniref:LIM and SH3 domain protein 1 n=1 Tax=Littorina saxatilis TaxID=31220 RepID=A0AAN9AU70_9CAEN
MSKKCAKCTKTVYPTEELKCLDKVWHKACFKCESCGMTLNMKNYKGYEKLPYCNAHYPTSRPTQVADTPESRRIAENTKIQSQVKYHADFERQKGHKTSVADDPETARIRQNTAIQSNINYWGVKEQRDAMEGRRPNEAIDDAPQVQKSKGLVCKAMYDYQAADSDEVSFMDGDLIIECTPVDAGWMTGRVERSGQYGMLPSNYVERIN